MTSLLFPDTTVLVNFALIGRMDLLELAVGGGRGRWCGTVATECRRSARQQGLDGLERVPAILGAPLYPETGAERLEVRHLRTELASPGDRPTDHLGEAETLAIILSRPEFSAFFVTDDRAAARFGGESERHRGDDLGSPAAVPAARPDHRGRSMVVRADAASGTTRATTRLPNGGGRVAVDARTLTTHFVWWQPDEPSRMDDHG